MVFLQGRSCYFCVGLFIMMIVKVVKCLDCRQGLLLKGDSVFIRSCYLFEIMYCGLLVLWVRSISVWGKKDECRGNVRVSASSQPIDAANNTLIDLSSTCNSRVEGFNRRNGVNGEPRTTWSHVGNLFRWVKREPMSCEFSECLLEYMYGDVSVFVFEPI